MPKKLDLIGQQFGRWTVLYRNGSKKTGQSIWHCKCECGNEKDIVGSELLQGRTKSCGCLQRELARQKHIKSNDYKLLEEYGIGYTSKGDEFYFDLDDYGLIKDYCWFKTKDGYITAKMRDGSGKHIFMHNLVMNQKYVDHIGGNISRNDNRKCNLRVFDNNYSFETYNNINKSLQSNNKSGYPGVCWHKRDNIWEVHISIDNNQIYLGRFENLEDAIKCRKQAEKEYFKDYSYEYSQKIAENNKIKEVM